MTVATFLQELHIFLGGAVYLEHDLFAGNAETVDVMLSPSVQSTVNDPKQLVVVTVTETKVDFFSNVLVIKPIQFSRFIDTYYADGVPFAKAKVLSAMFLVKCFQICVAAARIQQIQGTIHALDRPSRFYHYRIYLVTLMLLLNRIKRF